MVAVSLRWLLQRSEREYACSGAYTGEIIVTEFANPGRSMTIPVTLTRCRVGRILDNLPGG